MALVGNISILFLLILSLTFVGLLSTRCVRLSTMFNILRVPERQRRQLNIRVCYRVGYRPVSNSVLNVVVPLVLLSRIRRQNNIGNGSPGTRLLLPKNNRRGSAIGGRGSAIGEASTVEPLPVAKVSTKSRVGGLRKT